MQNTNSVHVRLRLRATAPAHRAVSVLLCIAVLTASSFAQGPSPTADGELKLVVALFRHGVRAPTTGFQPEEANKHSNKPWPQLDDWKVMDNPDCDPVKNHDQNKGWAYLTIQGRKLAQGLGRYYGEYYRQGGWSQGFNVYFWADGENQRTRQTAMGLAQGFRDTGLTPAQVTVDSLKDCKGDLLFHPFKAGCGTPDPNELARIANDINANWANWITVYQAPFDQLFRVLGCSNAAGCKFKGADKATGWPGGPDRTALITWKPQFSYASSASEAFLLEYANDMQVGWNNNIDSAAMRKMLFLHEFYFDQTERRKYLAQVSGSNLVKEISNVINRKATGQESGCPHAPKESQFVGLLGHDTNLAHVGKLFALQWEFNDPRLPDDTRGLPANDALPAGALVFELRQRGADYVVRVEYVTLSLQQMRNKADLDKPFRLLVRGPDCDYKFGPCEISLVNFNYRVKHSVDERFLSTCTLGLKPEQFCRQTPVPRRRTRSAKKP